MTSSTSARDNTATAQMRPQVSYARVHGPPTDWLDLDVIFNGESSSIWIEVNSDEGWGVRFARDAAGKLAVKKDGLVCEKVWGNFSLRYKDCSPHTRG